MMCFIPNTRIYIEINNRPLIPLEYNQRLLWKTKVDIEEIAINNIPDIPIWDFELYLNLTSHLLPLLLIVDLIN